MNDSKDIFNTVFKAMLAMLHDSAQKGNDLAKSIFLAFKDEIDFEVAKSRNKNEVLEKLYKNLYAIIEEFKIQDIKLAQSSFNSTYNGQFEINKNQKEYTAKELLAIDLGKALADSIGYLDSLSKQLKSSSTKKSNSSFTVRQQILILKYFGVLDDLEKGGNNSKKSIFLAGLINRNSQEIRAILSELNKFENPNTDDGKALLRTELENLKEIFTELYSEKALLQINASLQRLCK